MVTANTGKGLELRFHIYKNPRSFLCTHSIVNYAQLFAYLIRKGIKGLIPCEYNSKTHDYDACGKTIKRRDIMAYRKIAKLIRETEGCTEGCPVFRKQ